MFSQESTEFSSVFQTPGKLPSLPALRSFEAAARLGSIARAADALCVTAGAVSHQVKDLEAQLGYALFVRQGRGIRLTAEGRRLALSFNRLLFGVSQELAAIAQERDRPRLAVTVLPSFAARWLGPRLGRFIERHPDIELLLQSSRQINDLSVDGLDLAVRLGKGPWPGVNAEFYAREYCVVVASPELSAGLPRSISDLATKPLLCSDTEPWRPWFAYMGLDWPEPHQGVLFNDSGLVVQAALQGHGIGLARLSLVRDELASGKLLQLFAPAMPMEYVYWLVTPQAPPHRPVLQLFIDWLKDEMQQSIETFAPVESPR
jgi:LysR family glycine cleavage system transcriptional activator